ncbi:MAG: DNA primase [Myxococcota bacterium]|nr:DNA primase [Myxococcales bacterium]
MGRIPDATINEIRNRVDIVDLVGRYVQLKKAGRNFKGLCPFHDEKTPSFNVSSDKQIFHCFGCQVGGDVVGFLMRHENLTFPEAVRTLARECGVEVPEEHGDAAERGISEQVHEANEIAQRTYVDALASAEGEAARAYLAKRGLSGDDVRELGIGFAPDRWDTVARALAARKVGGDLGAKAGLLAERQGGSGHYDRLRGRVTFPIYDVRRRIVGFGGRALGADQEPKYLNTPESPVFRKRESFYGFPWALEAIRRSDRAIVCEGYFDRIALHRAGLGEGLATCGTALTREHARNLKRRTQTVVMLFDGDAAGTKAMERALEVLLPEGLRLRAAVLPDGMDPDDFLARHGADALRAVIDGAPDALELVMGRAAAFDRASPVAKAEAVARVVPLLDAVASPVERRAYVRRFALHMGCGEDEVLAELHERRRREHAVPEDERPAVRARRRGPADRHTAILCEALLRNPTLATDDVRAGIERGLEPGPWRALALALADASRAGHVDAEGEIDLFRVERDLGEEESQLLRELTTGDALVDANAAPERVVADVLDWFARQRAAAERRETTRRLELGGDAAAQLIAEKQRQLEERRARLRAQAPAARGVAR